MTSWKKNIIGDCSVCALLLLLLSSADSLHFIVDEEWKMYLWDKKWKIDRYSFFFFSCLSSIFYYYISEYSNILSTHIYILKMLKVKLKYIKGNLYDDQRTWIGIRKKGKKDDCSTEYVYLCIEVSEWVFISLSSLPFPFWKSGKKMTSKEPSKKLKTSYWLLSFLTISSFAFKKNN